jgi:hypothetical protein
MVLLLLLPLLLLCLTLQAAVEVHGKLEKGLAIHRCTLQQQPRVQSHAQLLLLLLQLLQAFDEMQGKLDKQLASRTATASMC